ncbi:MAG: hypothetical protein DI585_00185 [Pseudomonas fluorescens]|nr:MAG: hypothetical protein DI585_00185 [Pseudomonas fluorescens]
MTSEKKWIEPLIVYGLTVSGTKITADFANNCETDWMDKHLNEVLSATQVVMVAVEAEVYIVSQWPIPGVVTIADMEITAPETLSKLSGRIHKGYPDSVYQRIENGRVHYIVNEVGRIIVPAESPLAKPKAA